MSRSCKQLGGFRFKMCYLRMYSYGRMKPQVRLLTLQFRNLHMLDDGPIPSTTGYQNHVICLWNLLVQPLQHCLQSTLSIQHDLYNPLKSRIILEKFRFHKFHQTCKQCNKTTNYFQTILTIQRRDF